MQIFEQEISKYKHFVKNIAMKISKNLPKNYDIRDLIQLGQVGLIEALKKFDKAKGVQFQTYAYYRIKGAIYQGIKKDANLRYYNVKFEEGCSDLIQEENCQQSDGLEKNIDLLKSIIQKFTCVYILSIDAGMKISEEPTTEDTAISLQLSNLIKDAIGKLSEKEQKLIILYYYCGLNLKEAADKLNISKSWASRIHANAIKKLKDSLIPKLNY